MTTAVFALARPTFDVELAASEAAAAYSLLESEDPVAGGPQLLLQESDLEAAFAHAGAAENALILQASFCDAGMACAIADAYPGDLSIWAFPEERTGGRLRLNSFCGLNLAAHALRRRKRSCSYRYASPAAGAGAGIAFRDPSQPPLQNARKVSAPARKAAADALAAAAATGGIGLIGERPAGFDTCIYDERLAEESFGLPVRKLPLDEYLAEAAAVPPARRKRLRDQTSGFLTGLGELDAEEVDKAMGSLAALVDYARGNRLAGVAVRCWPETFTEYGCAVCSAMAELNEMRVPASCEADVMGTIASVLLQQLAEAPAMLVDVVDACPATDTLVLWHCGLAPRSYCAPGQAPAAAVHSNRKMALLNEFACKPGSITFARITAAYGAPALAIGSGEMLDEPRSFAGTSGVCRPKCGAQRFADLLIGAGLEHHLSFAYGDCKEELEAVAAQLSMPVLDLDDGR